MIPPADKKMLEKARPKLTGSISLNGSSLLDELRSRGAITENNQQIIESGSGNRKQVAILLDFLLKGGVDTLDKFIYSLRDSDHTELANECLREPNKSDNWDDDPAAGGQTASAQASGGTAAAARSATQEPILMTEEHKKTIEENFAVLSANLVVDSILNLLVSNNIISMDEQDDILEERRKDRARVMLKMITKRADKGFYVLRDGCTKNNMGHLAKLLKD